MWHRSLLLAVDRSSDREELYSRNHIWRASFIAAFDFDAQILQLEWHLWGAWEGVYILHVGGRLIISKKKVDSCDFVVHPKSLWYSFFPKVGPQSFSLEYGSNLASQFEGAECCRNDNIYFWYWIIKGIITSILVFFRPLALEKARHYVVGTFRLTGEVHRKRNWGFSSTTSTSSPAVYVSRRRSISCRPTQVFRQLQHWLMLLSYLARTPKPEPLR